MRHIAPGGRIDGRHADFGGLGHWPTSAVTFEFSPKSNGTVKFDALRAVGHNLADSLGSGICLLVGIYEVDVYDESRTNADGHIAVDFLKGEAINGPVSSRLAGAIASYRGGLADLCGKHGTTPDAFSELTARFSMDKLGSRVVVTVADRHGHRAEDEYIGSPARRVRVLDERGRVRRV